MTTLSQDQIILGIDPGLANTGWGVVEKRAGMCHCLGYGCITTPQADTVPERLKTIRDDVASIIKHFKPSDLAIETIFFGVNAKTEVVTAEARGAALIAAAEAGLTVGEYSPPQIKAAVVGNGAAGKDQVQFMVRAILSLKEMPQPDHAADALAAAVCHSRVAGHTKLEEQIEEQMRSTK
jgi:crossover junction endodeoxyribonuclease RuvC